MKFSSIIAAAVAGIALTACGGGGSSTVGNDGTEEELAVDFCEIDLSQQLANEIACANGTITVQANVRSAWSTQTSRIDSPSEWVVIASYSEQGNDVFIPLDRGSSRFDTFSCRVYGDLELGNRIRATEDGELDGNVEKLFFWPTESGDVTVFESVQGTGESVVLSYANTGNDVEITQPPVETDGL